ncbi:MAG TPA: GYD domain-containing protein [Acidimicrobiales bacterium]|jgi:uncharacterized protein with GYD domain|nr:GYD domain-containing protein [Acidimicrobiales bacterium]
MARYLIEASYSPDGMKGVLAKGGVARREAVEKMLSDLGGHVESFDFAFGDTDAYVLCDVPDNVSAAAVGMAVGASGMASCKTIVLLSPEEIDRAAQLTVSYRAPGS